MTAPRRRSRGFTLIELMISVAILGVLSSVAIPTLTRLSLRAKAAERSELMIRIKKAALDTYLQHGKIPGGELTGDFQPPAPATMHKRMPNWKTAGWQEIFRTAEEIEGATYYSYYFHAVEAVGATPPTLTIISQGDLDGDGVPSVKTIVFERANGMYHLKSETPAEGAEDDLTF